MSLRNSARPVRAICAASLTAIIGAYIALCTTTQSIAHAFGYRSGSLAYWAIHEPGACIAWLIRADWVRLDYATHHRTSPASEAILLGYYHDLLGQRLAIALLVAAAVLCIGTLMHHRRIRRVRRRAPGISAMPGQFSLHLGTSTGKLLAAGHGAGVTANQPLIISGDDCAQNIVVYGGIGSGKTTRMLNRLAAQAFEQDCGMLAFSIKGDDDLIRLASMAGREATVIGVESQGGRPCNLLHGLTPETASSFLKSALVLAGNTGGNAAFWVDHAVELARNALGVLSLFPEHYSLSGLFEYIFVPKFRDSLRPRIAQQSTRLLETDLAAADRLAAYAGYWTTIFTPIEERVKSGILAQLSTVLSPFTLPELRRAFCEQREDNVEMKGVIDGEVIIVALPLARYGVGAQVAYTLIKLRFYNVMQSRAIESTWNQTRVVVVLCDEYSKIATGEPDADYCARSRSSRCVVVIAVQGLSSLLAAIGEPLTKALLQNFRQQITFRTEDRATIQHFVDLFGQVEIERAGHSRTRSAKGGSASVSTGTSTSQTMRNVLDAQDIRRLPFGHAIAALSIRGGAYDDELHTEALFVADSRADSRMGAVA